MLKRLSPVLAAGTIAALAVAAPAAFAAHAKKPKHRSSCITATCVYHEQHQTTAGGQQATEHPHSVSASVGRKIQAYKGPDAAQLHKFADLGWGHLADAGSATGASSPSLLGAAFDVGFGPTALFALLLGTAIFLVGFSGVRRLRRS